MINPEIRFSQALFHGNIVKWQPEGTLDSQIRRQMGLGTYL